MNEETPEHTHEESLEIPVDGDAVIQNLSQVIAQHVITEAHLRSALDNAVKMYQEEAKERGKLQEAIDGMSQRISDLEAAMSSNGKKDSTKEKVK